MVTPNPFLALPVRSLIGVAVLLVPVYASLALFGTLTGILPFNPSDPIIAPILYSAIAGSLCLWVRSRCRTLRIRLTSLMGPIPRQISWPAVLWLTASVQLFSLGALQLWYCGLTWIQPHLAEATLQGQLVAASTPTALPGFYAMLKALIGVMAVPIIEEFLYRGIVLHRWGSIWGLRSALVISSVLIGVLNTNLIGVSIFSLVMALLYLKTHSLWVPILCHGFNNLLATSLDGLALMGKSRPSIDLMTDIQSSWWIGLLCVLVSSPVVVRFVLHNWPQSQTLLPYFANEHARLEENTHQA